MENLQGKIALVTGAASGIGRATALALASEGAHLIVCDIQEEALKTTAQEINQRSRCLLAKKVDVSKREEMKALSDEVHQLVPALDILVNNAGVGLVGGLFETDPTDWDWIIDINLKGVVHGCHFFAPKMCEQRKGQIVNMSSGLGYIGAPRTLAYSATKFAVLGLSESLRAELSSKGVGVSAICPGIIATNIISQNTRMQGVANEGGLRNKVAGFFSKRGHSPEIVASAVLKAIRQNLGVLPVSPEAWFSYYIKRFFPALSERFSPFFMKQVLGE